MNEQTGEVFQGGDWKEYQKKLREAEEAGHTITSISERAAQLRLEQPAPERVPFYRNAPNQRKKR